jgi:hypothetical protein
VSCGDGFASGDRVNFSDPIGLCKDANGNRLPMTECDKPLEPQGKSIERIGMVAGMIDGGGELAAAARLTTSQAADLAGWLGFAKRVKDASSLPYRGSREQLMRDRGSE